MYITYKEMYLVFLEPFYAAMKRAHDLLNCQPLNKIKGIVHPKRKIQVMPNLFFFFRETQKNWVLEPNSFDIQKKFIHVWEKKSYRFGTTWKWVHDSVDRNTLQVTRTSDYIFQATILQDIRVTLSNNASFSHLLTELSYPMLGVNAEA